ncbi:MAG TPA: glycosyltransferase [Solirubrobacteraceae bacterium]|nr:glycosyltransferase [Solirubrobacteraceae bacterium]
MSRRPLRLLFTLPWPTRSGGAEEMLQALVEGGPSHGYESEVAFLQEGPWPEQLRAEGVPVHVLGAGRVRELHTGARAVVRLARVLRRRRPDVIVNWVAKTQLYGSPAAVLAGMRDRVVWWQHAIPEGHWIDRVATALPAAAIGYTSHAAAEAQQRIRPARPMFVVAAGTRLPEPSRVAAAVPAGLARLPEGTLVVGLVARLQPWKGQDRLVRAAALLRERGHAVHVLLVGGDSWELAPDYARELPQLIADLQMADHVTMTGEVPDAGPYIDRMDVLVNASDPEPFGIVLLEAMARGVAVVAVDRGGPREIVGAGVSGMLARSGDPTALADAIEPLLDSPELRARLAAAGLERVRAEFTEDAMSRNFATQMRALVAAREGARSR